MGSRRGRTEAEDLLRIAEHRRSMHALRRAAAKAAHEGAVAATARPVSASTADTAVPDNVTDLAEVRSRRAEHATGAARSS